MSRIKWGQRIRIRIRVVGLLSLLAVLTTLNLTAAIKQPIKRPTYDPAAETVELFDGLEQGLFEATVIPISALEGNVFIENKSDKPLSVKLPPAVAAVQVLKQGFGNGNGVGNGTGNTGLNAGGNNQNGQAQPVGGGIGNTGANGGRNGGIFSIPPQKIVQVPLKSVCLAHGKPDPRPQMTYKLVRLDSHTKDPVLKELLTMYAAGDISQSAAQAAAWHLANDLSWEQLSAKQITYLGGVPPKPYFTNEQITAARQLVSTAEKRTSERPEKKL